jgi:predicted MFS family arabinose efflux permease
VRSRSYEIGLLLLLTLSNGVVALDRLIASFVSPYIVADLGLSNAQVGLLAGALSGAIAISAFTLGRVADVIGRRKLILIVCTIAFSIGSAAGGFASGFAFLLASRFALGIAEGPMVPVGQAVLAEESDPARRGFNMGFMQMTGAFLIGGMAGPVIATQIADSYGWRYAFFLSALPGILLALLLALFMRESRPVARGPRAPLDLAGTLGTLLRIRNMRLILAVAVLFTAWLIVQNTFLALYLTQEKQLAPTTAGWIISMGGIAGVVGGIALPFLSDRIGRKPVLVGSCLVGILPPLALMWLPADPVALGMAILIGWLTLGMAPLYCAVVPSESVSPALTTSAIGLAMGSAELFGGVAAPAVAGFAADAWGLEATLWLCAFFSLLAAGFSLLLKETAPGR